MLTEEMLRETAGEAIFAQGRILFHRALVREARRIKDEVYYLVSGDEKHAVTVTAGGYACDCKKNPCPHGVAAVLTALETGAMQELEKELRRGEAEKAAKAALYDAAKVVVLNALRVANVPVTVAELFEECKGELPNGFTKAKVQYGLTHYWTEEVVKTEGKVNTYSLRA